MYGMHVHNAVIINKEIESGITIHYVNENYDEGSIIFQKKIKILKSDDSLEISKRILKLEHEFFPIIIQKVLNNG